VKPSPLDRRKLRTSLAAITTLLLTSLTGCGAAPEQPHVEAKTRKQTPIAVCTMKLAPRNAGRGKAMVRTLEPEQWAEVAVPGFNVDKGLNPTDTDCTGHYAFANETLRGGISEKGWPHKLDPDTVDIQAGPDGLRTLWFRVLKFENGDEGGPLMLVRAVDDRAEIYAIGSFRGPTKSRIQPVRLGEDNMVVAESRICPNQDDCRKQAHFFLARRGRLIEAATVDVERVQILPSVTERGLYARYQLRTDVSYKPNGIQLLEQVKVSIIHYEDPNRDSDRNLRKVEFSRFLRVERDALFSSNEPLWERVVGQD
jgi:hypothetical protein